MKEDVFTETTLDIVLRLQNGLIAFATSGGFEGGDEEYKKLRNFLASRNDIKSKLPDFIRRCRDLAQFWGFIKFESYAGETAAP